MDTKTQAYLPSGPLDPLAAQIAEFFAANPAWTGMTSAPAAETRAAVREAALVLGEPVVEHVEDLRVPVAGGEIAVRLYRPAPNPPALVVWAHGGGFVLGSIEESDNFARALASRSGCAIASVAYRLAPEHKFPTAVEDVLAATQWLAERRDNLTGPVPMLLAGDSAGANLATVVTRRLHEAGACRIAGNILAYPCTDSPDAESLRRFESPFLGVGDVIWFIDQYLPDATLREHPDFAPIHAERLDLLPPTLIITAEHDVLTEQAEAYGHRLTDAGVPVRISRHAGMIHGFLTMDPFFPGAAGTAMGEIADFIADLAGDAGAKDAQLEAG